MFRSMMRANAISALLLVCLGAYILLDAQNAFPSDSSEKLYTALVQEFKAESRPEVLRAVLMEKLRQDMEMTKVQNAMLRRYYGLSGLMALLAAAVLASNAFALRRGLKGGLEKL